MNKSKSKGLSLRQKEAATGIAFIALPLISLILFMYYPIIRSFMISAFDWKSAERSKIHRPGQLQDVDARRGI